MERSLVPILATLEALAPLANNPAMSGRSIRSFRHLKHQNLYTGDEFILSSGTNFLVPLLATKEALALFLNDLMWEEMDTVV